MHVQATACKLGKLEVIEGRSLSVRAHAAGPVGILTAQCAMFRGAARVIVIDEHAYRLVRRPPAAQQPSSCVLAFPHHIADAPLALATQRRYSGQWKALLILTRRNHVAWFHLVFL